MASFVIFAGGSSPSPFIGGVRQHYGRGVTTAYPSRRGLPPPFHIQRELVPRFLVMGKCMVAVGIKTAAVETSQADIDPK
jgi:hypothetical protein